MYFDDFQARLKKGPLANLVLLYGEAEGILSEGGTSYKQAFQKLQPNAELQSFDGATQTLQDVLSAAQTVSLFGEGQLIFVRRAEKLLGGRSDEGVQLMAAYAMNPNSSSHLLFLGAGLKKTSKAVKVFEGSGWAVQCSEIPEWKIPAMVKAEAQSQGLSIPEEASQLLVQKVGPDLAYLKKALEQLGVMIHPRKAASLEDVRQLPVPGVESDEFAFLDMVGNRLGEKALRLLSQVPGGPGPGTLALLYGRMRELLGISFGRAKGLDQAALASQMGLNPWRVKILWDQSGKYSPAELKDALKDLIHLQAGMVTGRLGKTAIPLALETWVLKWGTASSVSSNRR